MWCYFQKLKVAIATSFVLCANAVDTAYALERLGSRQLFSLHSVVGHSVLGSAGLLPTSATSNPRATNVASAAPAATAATAATAAPAATATPAAPPRAARRQRPCTAATAAAAEGGVEDGGGLGVDDGEEHPAEAASYSIKDLYSMRLPELPAGEGVGGRLSVKQVKAYKELLQSTINIFKREYCEKIEVLFGYPTTIRLALCLEELDKQEQQLDELLGQTLMRSSQETTMKWIISMGHHH